MQSTKMRVVSIAAVVATLAFIGAPASAGSTLINDGSGVDFDAACLIADPLAPVGSGNNVPSPGANPNCLVGTYDSSTESTDFNSVSLSSNASGQIVAEFSVDGPIPPAGSALPPILGPADLPDDSRVTGFGYKAMFQNPETQTNTPYVAATRLTGTPIYGLNEHWADGFHFFVGFDAVWDGDNWLHSAQIGTYDPSPEGGFFFDELGVSNAPGVWTDDDPTCFPRAGGANWDVTYGPGNKVTVSVKGAVKFSDVQAVGGCVEAWYAKTGDRIINVKGLSSANVTVTLPVTIPLRLLPGFSNITSIGGFTSFSDITAGNSRNDLLGATLATLTGDNVSTPCNNEGLLGIRPCVSYTPGLARAAIAGEWLETDQEHELPGVFASPPDTLGDGLRCWTSTFGGLVPSNLLWVANQACYIDDDNIPNPLGGNIDPGERGTFLSEFWDTNFEFTF